MCPMCHKNKLCSSSKWFRNFTNIDSHDPFCTKTPFIIIDVATTFFLIFLLWCNKLWFDLMCPALKELEFLIEVPQRPTSWISSQCFRSPHPMISTCFIEFSLILRRLKYLFIHIISIHLLLVLWSSPLHQQWSEKNRWLQNSSSKMLSWSYRNRRARTVDCKLIQFYRLQNPSAWSTLIFRFRSTRGRFQGKLNWLHNDSSGFSDVRSISGTDHGRHFLCELLEFLMCRWPNSTEKN